jgi:hypothetical protein
MAGGVVTMAGVHRPRGLGHLRPRGFHEKVEELEGNLMAGSVGFAEARGWRRMESSGKSSPALGGVGVRGHG